MTYVESSKADKKAQKAKAEYIDRIEKILLKLQREKIKNNNNSSYDNLIEETLNRLIEARPVQQYHWHSSKFLTTKMPIGKCKCDDGKIRYLWEDEECYYTWDFQHKGEVEAFHKETKKHVGVLDKDEGGPILGKKIHPTRKIVEIYEEN